MSDYALLDSNGQVRRLVSGSEPPDDALPVEYPELDVTDTTHYIRRRHPRNWQVKDDRVVVTYDTAPRNLEHQKAVEMRRIRVIRDRVIADGITVTIGGTDYTLAMDERTVARVDQAALDAERRPDGWRKRWHMGGGNWVELDAERIEAIRAAGADHIEAAFNRHEALEAEIRKADSLEALAAIAITDGWPGGRA